MKKNKTFKVCHICKGFGKPSEEQVKGVKYFGPGKICKKCNGTGRII